MHWIYERPETGEKIFLIINSSMNTWVYIIKLFVIISYLKKSQNIFLKAQKRIKGKQDNLFKTTFTTFIPTFQVYNKAKVEE